MSTGLIVTLVCVALVLLGLVWTVVHYQRATGARPLLQGLGLILVPIGLWLTGVMDLIGNGIVSLSRFIKRTPVDASLVAGLIVAALGVLLFVVAGFIRPLTKEQVRERRDARLAKGRAQAPAKQGQMPAREAAKGPAPARPAARKTEVDEDDEIEALLKKRGIE